MKTNKNEALIEIRGILGGNLYEFQEIRKGSMNRIRDIVFRLDKGIGLREKQDKKEEKEYGKEFKDQEIAAKIKELKTKKKIGIKEQEFLEQIWSLSQECKDKEKEFKALLEQTTTQEPVWTDFLQYVKGIGPISTAILLQYFGYCEKAKYVSSLWRYAGYSVEGGKAPKPTAGQTLTYNPKLRTMMYRIGDSFVKHRTPFYRQVFDNEKDKQNKLLETKAENAPKSKKHAELRARRKMIKMFLEHYFIMCCKLTGRKLTKPYQFTHGEEHKTYYDVVELLKGWKAAKAKKKAC